MKKIPEDIYKAYLSSLISGDKSPCINIVNKLVEQDYSVKEIYINLFQKTLYRVGQMWEVNKISVATEHIATSITENVMALLYPKIFSEEHVGKNAVIACVANEYHQIGAKMVADIFELHGWDGYFIGANAPINDLLTLIEQKNADYICLSMSIFFNFPILEATLSRIRAHYKDMPILVGGQAFLWGGVETIEKFNDVFYMKSIDELEKSIVNF